MSHQMNRRVPLAVLIIAYSVFGFAAPAGAAVVTSWRLANSGSFDDPFNWDAGVPTSDDIALFDLDATYTVSFPGHFAIDPPANFATDELLVRDQVSFVDSFNPLTQLPDSYTVNSLIMGDTFGPPPVLNTTLKNFSAGSVSVSDISVGEGTLNVNGGSFNVTGPSGSFVVGNFGFGVLNVTGGAQLDTSAGGASLGLDTMNAINAIGFAAVSGAGTTWNSGNLIVGRAGGASVTIENGGTVTSGSSSIGFFPTSVPTPVGLQNTRTGSVTVEGSGSTWTAALVIVGGNNISGSYGTGSLDINVGGSVRFNGQLKVNSDGSVNLNGGELIVFSLSAADTTFNFNAGTFGFTNDKSLDDIELDQALGSAHTIGPLRQLVVEGTATLNTSVILDGGTFSVGQLVNSALLNRDHGTLNITDQAIAIESGGPLGDTLDLAADATVNVTLGLTNRGLVTGDGQIGGPFHNDAGGELRAEPGRSLALTGVGNANDGQINLFGGSLNIAQDLTNNAGGHVSGNGTLQVGGGLVNDGVMNFSGAANVVGQVTNSAAARIIASGGGPTTFFDDVTNDGEIRTSAGTYTVFFGAVDGSGTFTGAGTVNFEGDLSPGNSPAEIQFAGNVILGPEAELSIELGGTTLGSEYDHLTVAGDLSLDGTLAVSLIGDFPPATGDTFDILDWGKLDGAFAEVDLPSLTGTRQWDTSQLYTDGVLFVVSGLPGDYNNDGTVNAADYTVYRNRKAGIGGTTLINEGVTPGVVTIEDYDFWKLHYGETIPGSGSSLADAAANVPEPASWILMFAALAGLSWSRGPRRQARPLFG